VNKRNNQNSRTRFNGKDELA